MAAKCRAEMNDEKIMKNNDLSKILIVLSLLLVRPVLAEDEPENPWPREIPLKQGTVPIVNLHDYLVDSAPVVIADAGEDVELAFLRIDLEKIDSGEFVLGDNVRD